MALLLIIIKDPTAFFLQDLPPSSSDLLTLLVAFSMLGYMISRFMNCMNVVILAQRMWFS